MEFISRFVVEAHHDASILLDRATGDYLPFAVGPVPAAQMIARLIDFRDSDAYVEVFSSGVGLAMAGLLKAYGVNVISSYIWEPAPSSEPEPVEEEPD